MNTFRPFVLLLFVCVLTSRSAEAQYHWHTVAPNRIDTHQYVYSCVSCAGENCTATGLTFDYYPGELPSQMQPDICLVLISTDGGTRWRSLDGIPHFHYTKNSKSNILLNVTQQIDSLNALVAGQGNTLLVTRDGWQTWQQAKGFEVLNSNGDTLNFSFNRANFLSPSEGTLIDPSYAYTIYTNDSGKSWSRIKSLGPVACGHNTLRAVVYPNKILTSKDGWYSIDTSFMAFAGSKLFTSASEVMSWIFGGGDTITIIGSKLLRGSFMSQSTDLGMHWTDFSIPANQIYQPIVSPLNANTIVMGGFDSSGQITISKDHGTSWKLETVPFDDGTQYFSIRSLTVTGSGRIVASIIVDSTTDSAYTNTEVLAYLDEQSSNVKSERTASSIEVYPNPASSVLNVPYEMHLEFFDALGRAYTVTNHDGTLDISALRPGVYYISDGHRRAKFVKE